MDLVFDSAKVLRPYSSRCAFVSEIHCDQAIDWIYGGMQPAVFIRRAGCIVRLALHGLLRLQQTHA